MTLNQTTLETQLLNLTPQATEGAAITVLVNAYGVYALGAESNAVPITPAGVALGQVVMAPALVGMSAPNAGAATIAAAIVAFWAAAAIPPSFPTSTLCTPPPNAGLSAALTATFANNTATDALIAPATMAMASDMHAEALIGGTCTFPGPVVFPIL